MHVHRTRVDHRLLVQDGRIHCVVFSLSRMVKNLQNSRLDLLSRALVCICIISPSARAVTAVASPSSSRRSASLGRLRTPGHNASTIVHGSKQRHSANGDSVRGAVNAAAAATVLNMAESGNKVQVLSRSDQV